MDLRERLKRGEKTRILAFGASNTERFLTGMHWLDVVDLAVRDTYGRVHHCINAGVCGNTSLDLLARFEEDAAFYRPHVAIVTIGGNDGNPARGISEEQFSGNLAEIHRRFAALKCAVVFQTYYSPDPARNDDLTRFFTFMEIIRTVARETGADVVDHLPRWEIFRKSHSEQYLSLMHDGFHVNARGNAVLGLYTARLFGAQPVPSESWTEPAAMVGAMDALSGST